MSRSDERYAQQILATVSQPIVVLTAALEVETVNDAFCTAFDVTSEETENRQIYDLGNRQWDIPDLRRLLHEVLSERNAVWDYRVEHTFEQIGARTMLLNARRMARDDGDDRIVLTIGDITEKERQRHEIVGRQEFAEKLIDSIRESLIVLDWDLRVHSANQSFYNQFRVAPDETEGQMIYDLGNGQWDIPELREALEKILPQEWAFNDYEVEHEFEGIGRRVMLLNGRKLDHLDKIILAIRDITDRRDHERRQQAFMGELQHRIKNLLSNVRSLARQTRRRSSDLDSFLDAFMPRLDALSRAQDLLLKSPDDKGDLADIVRTELDAVGAEEGRTYSAEGPALLLSPRDTQAIAMAIHELATNAGKYGALRGNGGTIRVEWHIDRSAREIRFRWRELGVRVEAGETGGGFGSEVITKSVPHMLGGTSELDLHADGAECRITFPLPDRRD